MEKRIENFKNKRYFLLGTTNEIKYDYNEGNHIWLEEASWDCGWYWGIGYVETFTNDKYPNLSNDISSHHHFDSLFLFDKKEDGVSKFKKLMKETTLSNAELWQFIDYMHSMYIARKWSDICYRGKSNYAAKLPDDIKKLTKSNSEYSRINKIVIPNLLEKVYDLLTP